ncbi:MAG TPA: orotidine-5'-phosphate decarboxylase, partial [Ktedonobacterales bacterium]|nr:orotidine-5'-phosphate decarboxylase [Ktedonobacterales bacterium]
WHDGRTLLCVGLDPDLGRLPTAQGDTPAAVEAAFVAFNTAIIDATADLVCAYKPNAAFYERHGAVGWNALARTIAYIHSRYPDVPVLLDAKRGDIGSTAAAYADAIFDGLGADAVTLHPYLGGDALLPFLKRADRGCFILAHTSNPGATELQDLTVRAADGTDEPLYLAVARRVARHWNANGNCALVVGAPYPEQLQMIRRVAGDLPMLIPGIGAQGGDLAAVVNVGLDSQGAGLLISASRSVIYASSGADFAEAARHEAERLRDAIEALRNRS